MKQRISYLLISILLLTGCGTTMVNPVTGDAERTVMDEPTEVAEGAKGHQEVLKEYGVYNNPAVQAYVNTLGQKLAAQSHRANLQWHFTVLDSPEINAFALPGGYVYVTRGIMAYLESEADLAGVIGHEIVTSPHATVRNVPRASRARGWGYLPPAFGCGAESQGLQGAGQLAGQVSQTVAAGYVASYGRDQELQADGLVLSTWHARITTPQYGRCDQCVEEPRALAADQAKTEAALHPRAVTG